MNLKTTAILKSVGCSHCGCIFGIPDAMHDDRVDSARGVRCPNGHKNILTSAAVRVATDYGRRIRATHQAEQARAASVAATATLVRLAKAGLL